MKYRLSLAPRVAPAGGGARQSLNMHVRFSRVMSWRSLSFGLALILATGSLQARECFVRQPLFKDSTDNHPVCAEVEKVLNSTCDIVVPICEIRQLPPGSGLTLPPWEPIDLFDRGGREIKESFDQLESIAYAHYVTASEYSWFVPELPNRFLGTEEAKRSADEIRARVRAARARGRPARFEKAAIDLVGKGKPEVMYRFYSGSCRQPRRLSAAQLRNSDLGQEPKLFLERALSVPPPTEYEKYPNSKVLGIDVVSTPKDVVIFDGRPYVLVWGYRPALTEPPDIVTVWEVIGGQSFAVGSTGQTLNNLSIQRRCRISHVSQLRAKL